MSPSQILTIKLAGLVWSLSGETAMGHANFRSLPWTLAAKSRPCWLLLWSCRGLGGSAGCRVQHERRWTLSLAVPFCMHALWAAADQGELLDLGFFPEFPWTPRLFFSGGNGSFFNRNHPHVFSQTNLGLKPLRPRDQSKQKGMDARCEPAAGVYFANSLVHGLWLCYISIDHCYAGGPRSLTDTRK